jgi:RNA polymerase sigma factor (sigma-70 family)
MGEPARREERRPLRPVDDSFEPDAPELGPWPGRLPTFGEAYHAWRGELVQLAYLILGSPEIAHDVVQDAFVRVHPRWSSLREPRAYLRRAVVNGCRSHQRAAVRQRRAVTRLAGERERASQAPDELGDALATLSHRERAALVLRFYADLPDADIAAALGCRPGTVGSLVHRGLARMRKAIER